MHTKLREQSILLGDIGSGNPSNEKFTCVTDLFTNPINKAFYLMYFGMVISISVIRFHILGFPNDFFARLVSVGLLLDDFVDVGLLLKLFTASKLDSENFIFEDYARSKASFRLILRLSFRSDGPHSGRRLFEK
jgi:hypothetical protein